jgi:hypothetical protein
MKDASTASAASVELQNVFASSSIFSLSRGARTADAGSAFVSLHALEDDIDVGALSDPPVNEDTYAPVTPSAARPGGRMRDGLVAMIARAQSSRPSSALCGSVVHAGNVCMRLL